MVEHWAFHSVAILVSMRAASKDHSVAVKTIRLSAALLDVPMADLKVSKMERESAINVVSIFIFVR